MSTIRYHDSVNVLQGLSLPDGAVCAPFDRPEWFQLLEDAGLQPLIVEDADSGCALPLTKKDSQLAPLRNWYSFTWRPLAGPDPVSYAGLVRLAQSLKTRCHRAVFEPVPDEDGSATRWAKALQSAGWRVHIAQCDTNHFLEVNGRGFAEYWASRPGPLRTTLKRKAKKVETTISTAFDPAEWQAYEKIYAQSWKPGEDYPAMLRAFAEQEGAAGRLRLAIARHVGEPVAAQFWTVENGTAFIHKLAHLESHKNLSAGTTLSAALFERAIDTDQVEWVDFGTGDEPYKRDWMEQTRERFRIEAFDLSTFRGWIAYARYRIRQLRRDAA